MSERKNTNDDPVLFALTEAIEPTLKTLETSEDYSLLVIGTKYDDSNKGHEGVVTFMACSGLTGILEEGLYSELRFQIEEGDVHLFNLLRNVINDLEEDLEIDDDEELEGNGHGQTLH
jgi:hypothetical protein